MNDRIIRATGKVAEVRYVLADLTQTARTIARQHQLHGDACVLLGDACVASAFLSASMKSAGAVTFEARFHGLPKAVFAESTPLGLIRAKISQMDVQALQTQEFGIAPDMIRVRKVNEFGKQIAESLVPMEDARIGPALASYILQSEQTRSGVSIITAVDPADPQHILFCGGFYVEAFPKADDKTLIIQEQCILDLPPLAEFAKDDGFDIENLLDLLAGPFEYEVHRTFEAGFHCPCSTERIEASLTTLPLEDLLELQSSGEDLDIHCDYCRTQYTFNQAQLSDLIQAKG